MGLQLNCAIFLFSVSPSYGLDKAYIRAMTIEECLAEWKSKNRRSGCVAATNFLCTRVDGFYPLVYHRWTDKGDYYRHVVATDGAIVIDLSPENDTCEGADDQVIPGPWGVGRVIDDHMTGKYTLQRPSEGPIIAPADQERESA